MNDKNNRRDLPKMLITRRQKGSQDEVLQALSQEGIKITQATLSRDMKQLKVAKAATVNGTYIYVLPNETMYKRVHGSQLASEMLRIPGFQSINFSGNIGVIKTRPGYASSIAYNIDNSDIPEILGTIAGDDTIFIVVRQGSSPQEVVDSLETVIPDIK